MLLLLSEPAGQLHSISKYKALVIAQLIFYDSISIPFGSQLYIRDQICIWDLGQVKIKSQFAPADETREQEPEDGFLWYQSLKKLPKDMSAEEWLQP
jgi:hypothetical protein